MSLFIQHLVNKKTSVQFNCRSLENLTENYFISNLFFTDGIVHGYHYFFFFTVVYSTVYAYFVLEKPDDLSTYYPCMIIMCFSFPQTRERERNSKMNFHHYKAKCRAVTGLELSPLAPRSQELTYP